MTSIDSICEYFLTRPESSRCPDLEYGWLIAAQKLPNISQSVLIEAYKRAKEDGVVDRASEALKCILSRDEEDMVLFSNRELTLAIDALLDSDKMESLTRAFFSQLLATLPVQHKERALVLSLDRSVRKFSASPIDKKSEVAVDELVRIVAILRKFEPSLIGRDPVSSAISDHVSRLVQMTAADNLQAARILVLQIMPAMQTVSLSWSKAVACKFLAHLITALATVVRVQLDRRESSGVQMMDSGIWPLVAESVDILASKLDWSSPSRVKTMILSSEFDRSNNPDGLPSQFALIAIFLRLIPSYVKAKISDSSTNLLMDCSWLNFESEPDGECDGPDLYQIVCQMHDITCQLDIMPDKAVIGEWWTYVDGQVAESIRLDLSIVAGNYEQAIILIDAKYARPSSSELTVEDALQLASLHSTASHDGLRSTKAVEFAALALQMSLAESRAKMPSGSSSEMQVVSAKNDGPDGKIVKRLTVLASADLANVVAYICCLVQSQLIPSATVQGGGSLRQIVIASNIMLQHLLVLNQLPIQGVGMQNGIGLAQGDICDKVREMYPQAGGISFAMPAFTSSVVDIETVEELSHLTVEVAGSAVVLDLSAEDSSSATDSARASRSQVSTRGANRSEWESMCGMLRQQAVKSSQVGRLEAAQIVAKYVCDNKESLKSLAVP